MLAPREDAIVQRQAVGEVVLRAFALPGKLGDRWSDYAYVYLRALQRAGVPTRLGALHPIDVTGGKVDGKENAMAHWRSLSGLITTPLTQTFVNLAIVPLGMSMGGPKLDPHYRVAYRPQTMLAGLRTSDVLNVALTGMENPLKSPRTTPQCDVDALGLYHEVYAITVHDRQHLASLGCDAPYLRPDPFADRMRQLVEGEGQD